jgi:hypothetical protein
MLTKLSLCKILGLGSSIYVNKYDDYPHVV